MIRDAVLQVRWRRADPSQIINHIRRRRREMRRLSQQALFPEMKLPVDSENDVKVAGHPSRRLVNEAHNVSPSKRGLYLIFMG
jgi:hypothetical protein